MNRKNHKILKARLNRFFTDPDFNLVDMPNKAMTEEAFEILRATAEKQANYWIDKGNAELSRQKKILLDRIKSRVLGDDYDDLLFAARYFEIRRETDELR